MFTTAEIHECSPNTHSFEIELSDSSIVTAKALSQNIGLDGASDQITMYRQGTQVICGKTNEGEHIILGCVPNSYSRIAPGEAVSLGDTEVDVDRTELSSALKDTNYINRGSESHRAYSPAEALPGDYIYRAEGGNSLKILKGGINNWVSEKLPLVN